MSSAAARLDAGPVRVVVGAGQDQVAQALRAGPERREQQGVDADAASQEAEDQRALLDGDGRSEGSLALDDLDALASQARRAVSAAIRISSPVGPPRRRRRSRSRRCRGRPRR